MNYFKNYYTEQVKRVVHCGAFGRDFKGPVKVQLRRENVTTQWMDINKDSIRALRFFLDEMEREIDEQEESGCQLY